MLKFNFLLSIGISVSNKYLLKFSFLLSIDIFVSSFPVYFYKNYIEKEAQIAQKRIEFIALVTLRCFSYVSNRQFLTRYKYESERISRKSLDFELSRDRENSLPACSWSLYKQLSQLLCHLLRSTSYPKSSNHSSNYYEINVNIRVHCQILRLMWLRMIETYSRFIPSWKKIIPILNLL